MKLKKLLKVLPHNQVISFVATKGGVTQHSEIIHKGTGRSIQPIEEYNVLSIRSVHDELQLPDYQDYIEIRLQGGNDND